MKRLFFLFSLCALLWADEPNKEPLPPHSVDAPSGKPLYQPVREPINAAEETRIQQDNGVTGGRGVPMHSYGDAKDEHSAHRDH
jgi:hypothetical protein